MIKSAPSDKHQLIVLTLNVDKVMSDIFFVRLRARNSDGIWTIKNIALDIRQTV